MLSNVEITTSQGDLLSIPFQGVYNGFLVQEINGLDPVKATLVSSSFAQQDGAQYQSSRREPRNITLQIGLESDFNLYSVRDLRKRLYNFFMPKSEVNLRFFDTDGPTVNILGRSESCETAIWSKEPAMDISLICYDPDFIDLDPTDLSGQTTASTTEDDDLVTVDYTGEVSAGVTFVLHVDRTLTEFTIYHNRPDNTYSSLDFSAPLVADDVLTISTVSGNKGATLTRAGADSSLLYGISPQSGWFELIKGENTFRFYAEGDPIPFDLVYTNRYGGL